jgi:hypothetical protein
MNQLGKLLRLALAGTLFTFVFSVICARSAYGTTVDFDITWSGTYGTGSATLTTTADGGGEYTVTNITGTQGSLSIGGLASYGDADQTVYYPATPALDFAGIAFSVGSTDYNLWNGDGNTNVSADLQNSYNECSSAVTACDTYATDDLGVPLTSFTITEVTAAAPEPSSLGLLFVSLLGFLVMGWMRKSSKRSILTV